MSEKPRRYLSYLLRLWQASSGGELVWRASLEDPHPGDRRILIEAVHSASQPARIKESI